MCYEKIRYIFPSISFPYRADYIFILVLQGGSLFRPLGLTRA
nr:MAG TPA: hypothetical protein [Caudoviricetes sp.]